MSKVLGISAFYHDSAASLLIDGEIITAVQEERFTRIKHDYSFPDNSIKYIFEKNKININEIEKIIFYEKPFLKFERLLDTYVSFAPKGFKSFSKAMPIWLKEKLFQKKLILDNLQELFGTKINEEKLFFSEHHLSHAASAFYPSPFEEAIIFTADGVGEWATTTVAIGKGNDLKIIKEIHFPHSLGLLYSAFTYYTGFKVNSGEYKLMGLAPYGKPKFKDIIYENLIDVKSDGSFWLNQSFFDYATGLKMINKKFETLFGEEARSSENNKITQFHMDIAASIQKVTEEIVLKIVTNLRDTYKITNLCLAGGVALNCVANGKIVENQIFDNIWIQPAAGDTGGSLGACLAYWYLEKNHIRKVNINDDMKGSYLGPEYSNLEIENQFKEQGVNYEVLDDKDIISKAAECLSNGEVIGWFQGKMEFGPRALGARSILGDPRSSTMQKNLNLKIKYRESFRPFAPAIIYEELNNWFELDIKSPYMLIVSKVKEKIKKKLTEKEENLFGIEKLNIKRSELPAVTHVDYSARVQTVHKETNLKFYKLLTEFKNLTGCPVLVNTSFNVRGEPIVNTPIDAYNCLMGTELDKLFIENFVVDKKKQSNSHNRSHKKKFNLD